MDLGIRGKKAIICTGPDGIALSAAEALALAGVELTLQGPDKALLSHTADYLRALCGILVDVIDLDVRSADGRRLLLETMPNADILITSVDIPYGSMWFDWNEDMWRETLQAAMLTPVLMMSTVLPGMIERGWGRIVNITAPRDSSGLSAAVSGCLVGFVSVAAKQVSRHGIAINTLSIENLLETPTSIHRTARGTRPAKLHGGQAQRLAAMAAFLCSQHCGSVVGQTIQMDREAV